METKTVLEYLSGKFTLGMLTDGFLPAQKLKVQALGLNKYFKHIIYTELIGRKFWKPSPKGFQRLSTNLNTQAREMAYIGDNEEKDFIAPNSLGFTSIQLIRKNRIHTKISDHTLAKPKYKIESLSDLPALIEHLNQPNSINTNNLL